MFDTVLLDIHKNLLDPVAENIQNQHEGLMWKIKMRGIIIGLISKL